MKLIKVKNKATITAGYLVVALCLIAPFSMLQKDFRATGIITILIAACWIAGQGWLSLKYALSKRNAFTLGLFTLIAVIILGLPFSQNLTQALSLLELNLTTLILALFFLWQKDLPPAIYSLCKKAFTIGVFLSSLYIFRQGLQPFIDDSILKNCLFCVVELLVPMHRPYFALYIILAICILGSSLRANQSSVLKISVLGVILYFSLYLLLMMPKSAIIGFMAGVSLLILKLFFNKTISIPNLGLIVGIFLLLLGSVYYFIQTRKDYSWQWQESSVERRTVWQASVEELMTNYHFIIGIGTGDESDAIYAQIQPYNPVLAEKKLNAHNQYLAFWIRFGIPGLMLIIFLVILPIAAGWVLNNYTLLIWSTTLAFAFLTENILNREAGVIIFCLWIPLLLQRPTTIHHAKTS